MVLDDLLEAKYQLHMADMEEGGKHRTFKQKLEHKLERIMKNIE